MVTPADLARLEAACDAAGPDPKGVDPDDLYSGVEMARYIRRSRKRGTRAAIAERAILRGRLLQSGAAPSSLE